MRSAGAMIAFLMLAASGCDLALAYPADQPEHSMLACHDRSDQDLDGLVDCADRDCTPFCPEVCSGGMDEDLDGALDCADRDCDGSADCREETPELCRDGHDNDLDGRVDARDAACWPFARSTFTRCATVLHTSIDASPRDLIGGTLVTDPFGRGETEPWVQLSTDATAPVTSLSPSTGALEGTHASIALHFLEPHATPGHELVLPAVFVTLSVPSPTRIPTRSIQAAIFGTSLAVIADGTPVQFPLLRTATPDVDATLEVEIRSGAVAATLTIAGMPMPAVVAAPLDASWPEAPALELSIASMPTVVGAQVYVEHASVARQHLVRCGAIEPPLGIVDTGLAETANVALESLVRGEGRTLCGIAYVPEREDQLRAHSIASPDDGATFVLGESLVRPTLSVVGPLPASEGPALRMAYDALAREVVTTALIVPSMGPAALYESRSRDCLAWDRAVVAIDDVSDAGRLALGTVTGPAGYAVSEEGHTLVFFVWEHTVPPGARIARWTSPWGDPGTWIEGARDASATFLPVMTPATPSRATWIDGLGAEVIAPSSADGPPRVRHADGWREASAATLSPSGEAGAFDALAVTPIAYVEDACTGEDAMRDDVWCGRLYYTGQYDALASVGFGHALVRIAPVMP